MPYNFDTSMHGGGYTPGQNYDSHDGSSWNKDNFLNFLTAGGSGLASSLFGGHQKNPANAAMPYFNQIPSALHEGYDPYIQHGNQSGDLLQGEYGNLVGHPGNKLNEIGGGYQQSPGFKFALQQALQGAGHAAAAGGMAGSPQHEFENMQLSTNLANQDYNSWIKNALGLYDTGISGEQKFYDTGSTAGMNLGQDLASALAMKGQYAFGGQAGKNAGKSQNLSNLIGGAGALAAFL
jgi:hypothetical protein